MGYLKVSKIVTSSITDKRLIKLSDKDIQNLKSAAEIGLAVIAAVGIATVAVVAPNLLKAIGIISRQKGKSLSFEQKQERIKRVFYYLKRHGYIRMKADGNDVKISLTKSGKGKLNELKLVSLSVASENKWNGRWWQVAADIPTKDYRWAADLFRRKIKEMGFFALQRTLWFYPFDPRKEIEFISQHYGIGQYVTVMEINRLDLDDENILKGYFKNGGIL